MQRRSKEYIPLGVLNGLGDAPVVSKSFNTRVFKFKMLSDITLKKRNASRPGLNGIPYKVYKKCPSILKVLFDIMIRVKNSGVVPLKWRISDGIFIPKTNTPDKSRLTDFRQIALGNVEGKLFWSLVSDRVYDHLVVNNSIIDTRCQKGSIKKMSGVLEHTSMVWSALKDARSSSKSMAVIWLDLANADRKSVV